MQVVEQILLFWRWWTGGTASAFCNNSPSQSFKLPKNCPCIPFCVRIGITLACTLCDRRNYACAIVVRSLELPLFMRCAIVVMTFAFPCVRSLELPLSDRWFAIAFPIVCALEWPMVLHWAIVVITLVCALYDRCNPFTILVRLRPIVSRSKPCKL